MTRLLLQSQRLLRLLQQALGLTADGAFGAKTEAALKRYQKGNGLKPDGKYGRKTNRKMKLFDWGDR